MVCEVEWRAPVDSTAIPLPAFVDTSPGVPVRGPQRGVRDDPRGVEGDGRGRAPRGARVGRARHRQDAAGRASSCGTRTNTARRCLWGRCDEELSVPFEPFAEALRHYVACVPADRVKAELGSLGGELTRILPDLSARVPGLAAPVQTDPETERHRLFEAVSDFLAAMSHTDPVILVLDDIHWADKPSLLMLRHILRSGSPMRLFVLATYRDTDLDRTHPLSDVLADLRRQAGVDRVDLGGLGPAEVTSFMEAAAGHELARGRPRARAGGLRGDAGQPVLRRRGAAPPRGVGRDRAARRPLGRATRRSKRSASPKASARCSAAGCRGCRRTRTRRSRSPRSSARRSTSRPSRPPAVRPATSCSTRSTRPRSRRSCARCPAPSAATRSRTRSCAPRCTRSSRRTGACACTGGSARRSRRATSGTSTSTSTSSRTSSPRARSRAIRSKAVDYCRRAGEQAEAELAFEAAAQHYERAVATLELVDDADPALRCDLQIALATALRNAGDERRWDAMFAAAASARALGDAERLARAALGHSRATSSGTTVDAELRRPRSRKRSRPSATNRRRVRARLLIGLAVQLQWGPGGRAAHAARPRGARAGARDPRPRGARTRAHARAGRSSTARCRSSTRCRRSTTKRNRSPATSVIRLPLADAAAHERVQRRVPRRPGRRSRRSSTRRRASTGRCAAPSSTGLTHTTRPPRRAPRRARPRRAARGTDRRVRPPRRRPAQCHLERRRRPALPDPPRAGPARRDGATARRPGRGDADMPLLRLVLTGRARGDRPNRRGPAALHVARRQRMRQRAARHRVPGHAVRARPHGVRHPATRRQLLDYIYERLAPFAGTFNWSGQSSPTPTTSGWP